VIDVKETGLDGGRLAIPPVIARSVSDMAISDKYKIQTSKGKMTSQKLKVGHAFRSVCF
jgi:hypothetical protein